MSRNRYSPTLSRSEHIDQFATQTKRPTPAAVHSPRKGLIGDSAIPSHLHSTPVAVAVSATGERTLCPIVAGDGPINNTNPFANEQNESIAGESTAERYFISSLQAYPKHRHQQPRRRKRRYTRGSLTQRGSTRQLEVVLFRSVSSQTDPVHILLRRPRESVGDQLNPRNGRLLSRAGSHRCIVGELGPVDKKRQAAGGFSMQFLPECLKYLASYVIMVTLIFWLLSVTMDMNVPADFIQIATNYLRSFSFGQYRPPPQTSAEKCLEYLLNFFK